MNFPTKVCEKTESLQLGEVTSVKSDSRENTFGNEISVILGVTEFLTVFLIKRTIFFYNLT